MGNVGSMDRRSAEIAARQFEEALSKRPIEEQLAVGTISKNVLNGCSWEFIRPNPEIKRHLEDFKKSPVCSVQEVTYNHEQHIYGYLIYMQMSHLCKLLDVRNKGPLEPRDLEIARKHRDEAQINLVKKMKSGYKGRIGIFCTNDSQTITVKGNTYPAYALTLKELCVICNKCGYGIVVNNIVRDPAEVLKREDAVLKSLTVAPSSNALFINIAPR